MALHPDCLEAIAKNNLKTGAKALMACGMQHEFAANLTLMQQASHTTLILRAGAPPVYDRPRQPKTGLNLSKTSTQGFFKGQIAADVQFTRVKKGKDGKNHAIGHHKKDKAKLQSGEQNCVQLPVRMKDIIRELRDPGGDLKLTSYNPESGEVRFQYKEGKGDTDFKGDFVININQGKPFDAHFSRSWDRPDQDPEYDFDNKIIKKPDGVPLSDEAWQQLYQAMDGQECPLFYTDPPNSQTLKEARAFANKEGLIITGDWDGLATGHPPELPEYARQVFNTFDPINTLTQKQGLIDATEKLFYEKLEFINGKIEKGETLTSFEEAMTKIDFDDLYTDFSLSRAGCITAHEFLNNSVANHIYRNKNENDMRDQSQLTGYQESFDAGLKLARQQLLEGQDLDIAIALAKNAAMREFVEHDLKQAGLEATPQSINQRRGSDTFNKVNSNAIEKINQALEKTIHQEYQMHQNTNGIHSPLSSNKTPKLPHPDYDSNVENLFQHGYDMRNPYGSNLEGAWLMITEDGMTIHGDTQAELLDVILAGDFLEQNHMDVNFAADMSKGWDKVIERQLALGQTVPKETLHSYSVHQNMQTLQKELGEVPSLFDRLTGKSVNKQSIADETGKMVETYNTHKQNIPQDLMVNYMGELEKQLDAGKPLNNTTMNQLEVLFENYKDMEPSISEKVIQGYLKRVEKNCQQSPETRQAVMEKVSIFNDNMSSPALDKWVNTQQLQHEQEQQAAVSLSFIEEQAKKLEGFEPKFESEPSILLEGPSKDMTNMFETHQGKDAAKNKQDNQSHNKPAPSEKAPETRKLR